MDPAPLLVIGLDGCDFSLLDQFAGELDTISQLRERGTETPLQSTHPPWTPSAWPSLYTGVEPSTHGVFDFFQYADQYPDEAEPVSRYHVHAPAIWDYLSDRQRSSIVVNVPITHPATALEGTMLPGYMAPPDEDGYPVGIRAAVSEAIGEPYAIYSEFETGKNQPKKFDGYERLVNQRMNAAAYLLRSRTWDFAFVVVQKTDTVFHNSTSTDDFKRIYVAADRLIRSLIECCPVEPNVLICSDHGMGVVDGYTLYVNELLKQHGYIETVPDSGRTSLHHIKGADKDVPWRKKTANIVGTLIRKSAISPVALYNVANKYGIWDEIHRSLPAELINGSSYGVDWRASEAYCRRASEQGIRLNVAGRDPDGVVPPERYEQVRSEIIELLRAQQTPDGGPIFEFVVPREEVYRGPYRALACDILFRTASMNHNISTNLYGETMVPVDTYNHKMDGVFIAAGPDIAHRPMADGLSILDVAPIVFSLLREPIPDRLQGSVPTDILTTPVDRESYATTMEFDGHETRDRDGVHERLRDLGYL